MGRPLRPCVNIFIATGLIGKEGKIREDNGAKEELGNVWKGEQEQVMEGVDSTPYSAFWGLG